MGVQGAKTYSVLKRGKRTEFESGSEKEKKGKEKGGGPAGWMMGGGERGTMFSGR